MTQSADFKDYFSTQSKDYARYRPHYPSELFEYLASTTSQTDTAWDCATGNGQVAVGLTPYFQHIYATDASPQQVSQAFSHTAIQYSVATAEASGLPDQSIDLITVGQALHWFNLDAFYAEVRRVLKPQGAIAVWCYDYFELPQASDDLLQAIANFHDAIEPFWPPERDIVLQGYRTLPFPFQEQPTPQLYMTADWNAEQLMGYLCTWSSVQRFIAQNGATAIAPWVDTIITNAAPSQPFQVQWRIHLRVGQVA